MNKETQVSTNKAQYRRFIQEVFNEGRVQNLPHLVCDNYQMHDAPPGSPQGRAAIAASASMFRSAFPDLKITIEELIGEGDLLAARTIVTGTHKGPIFGIDATDRAINMASHTMVRFVDGRLRETWLRNDTLALMTQLNEESRS